jgi:hypothetical protein
MQGSTFSAVMMHDAMKTYLILNKGKASAWTFRLATAVFASFRLLLLSPGLALGDGRQRSTRKLSFARWWAVLSWSCGRQKWTKRYSLDELQAQEAPSVGR